MNKQELNKKLAEWVGLCWHDWEFMPVMFKRARCKKCGQEVWGIDANYDKPNFTQSLDACLKQLFPKLVSDNKLWGHFVELVRWEGLAPNRKRLSDGKMIKRLLDPMFICQTIEKLIDEG